jgi:hypothetical protein
MHQVRRALIGDAVKHLIIAFVAAAIGAQPARAEPRSTRGPFLVSYDVGALVARGARRNLLGDAVLVGVTGGYELSPFLAIVASVARARVDTARGAERSLLQYDVGARAQYPVAAGAEATVVPFLTTGVGGRTTDDRDVGRDLDTDLTGYVGLGARLEYSFANLSVSARDLVSSGRGAWFAHGSSTRHDLALCASFGVRF